jgi:hypothetical protein
LAYPSNLHALVMRSNEIGTVLASCSNRNNVPPANSLGACPNGRHEDFRSELT